MRSYEAARSLFGFLEFIAWSAIVVGFLAAFSGGVAVNQYSEFGQRASSYAVVFATLPGLAIAFAGFLIVALVQNARATVDTAEYTQQMLQIARDQLEVSRQGLNKGKSVTDGFAALNQAKSNTEPEVSKATGYESLKTPEEKPKPTIIVPATVLHEVKYLNEEQTLMEYRGMKIELIDADHVCNDKLFPTRGLAKDYIDELLSKPIEPISPALEADPPSDALIHRGRTIASKDGKFSYAGIDFADLEAAKRYVDTVG